MLPRRRTKARSATLALGWRTTRRIGGKEWLQWRKREAVWVVRMGLGKDCSHMLVHVSRRENCHADICLCC